MNGVDARSRLVAIDECENVVTIRHDATSIALSCDALLELSWTKGAEGCEGGMVVGGGREWWKWWSTCEIRRSQ